MKVRFRLLNNSECTPVKFRGSVNRESSCWRTGKATATLTGNANELEKLKTSRKLFFDGLLKPAAGSFQSMVRC